MKIALIGGHLAPALAVLDELQQKKEAEVIFFGREYSLEGDKAKSLEYKVVTERGVSFFPVTAGRVQRKLTRHTPVSLLKIPAGLFQALQLLRSTKPDVVLGFGGYVSVPIAFASYILRMPVIIHEQTLGVGLANKLIAPIATKICISWKQSERYFPKRKTVLTGNPLRKFSGVSFPLSVSNEHIPLLYITGGSAGSHAINVFVEACLEKLLRKYRVIHQTGDAREFGDFERLQAQRAMLPEKLQKRYHIVKFISPQEVGMYMKAADLIVSRSGMNTVTELFYFGKPSLLIPLPYGQKNEQLKNAQFLKKVGIGDYLEQDKITDEIFSKKIETMVEMEAFYLDHAKAAKALIREDAAEDIVKVAYEVSSKK